jgi:hypothetical protein
MIERTKIKKIERKKKKKYKSERQSENKAIFVTK